MSDKDFEAAVERFRKAVHDSAVYGAGVFPRTAPARQALLAQHEALQAEVGRLTKTIATCSWYWPEEDTSSEYCADGPWDIYRDGEPGDVFAISRGGVVETRYYGWLPPASDADSDDDFDVNEATEAEARAKIDAEISRRSTLSQATGTEVGK